LTFEIDYESSAEEITELHHRTKRIAYVPRKNKTSKGSNSTTGDGDDDMDYPEGFFIPPGKTDAPEAYDYDATKFNRSYLTRPEWKKEAKNRTRKYEESQVEGKKALIDSPVNVIGNDSTMVEGVLTDTLGPVPLVSR
jgi:hypothetical protein